MDIKELRELTPDRLTALEQSLRKQIFDARIKNYTNQLDDTASIRRLRRDMARVKTVHSELIAAGPIADDAAAADDSTADDSAVEEAVEAADAEPEAAAEEETD